MLVQERESCARERREIVTWKLVYCRVVRWRERGKNVPVGKKLYNMKEIHTIISILFHVILFSDILSGAHPHKCSYDRDSNSLSRVALNFLSLEFSPIDFSLSRNPIFDDQQRAFDEEYLMSGTPSSWTCFSPDRSAEKIFDRTGKISSQLRTESHQDHKRGHNSSAKCLNFYRVISEENKLCKVQKKEKKINKKIIIERISEKNPKLKTSWVKSEEILRK